MCHARAWPCSLGAVDIPTKDLLLEGKWPDLVLGKERSTRLDRVEERLVWRPEDTWGHLTPDGGRGGTAMCERHATHEPGLETPWMKSTLEGEQSDGWTRGVWSG